ncbi:hypothetical protein FRAHR75_740006 [Frankia sp. Hr75.2]|nr:hypothetical protein FRAHR75_740006 [Frankia sp. Hr75.2]
MATDDACADVRLPTDKRKQKSDPPADAESGAGLLVHGSTVTTMTMTSSSPRKPHWMRPGPVKDLCQQFRPQWGTAGFTPHLDARRP